MEDDRNYESLSFRDFVQCIYHAVMLMLITASMLYGMTFLASGKCVSYGNLRLYLLILTGVIDVAFLAIRFAEHLIWERCYDGIPTDCEYRELRLATHLYYWSFSCISLLIYIAAFLVFEWLTWEEIPAWMVLAFSAGFTLLSVLILPSYDFRTVCRYLSEKLTGSLRILLLAVMLIVCMLSVHRAWDRLRVYEVYGEFFGRPACTEMISLEDETQFSIVNRNGYGGDRIEHDLELLPDSMLSQFRDDGWELVIDAEYLAEYSLERLKETNKVLFYKLILPDEKKIIVSNFTQVLSSIGAYYAEQNLPKNLVDELFSLEPVDGSENAYENFSRHFCVWMRRFEEDWQYTKLKENAPVTCDILNRLEQNQWQYNECKDLTTEIV